MHKEINELARFNKYGLLENTFDEVVVFSSKLQGHGEPVEWRMLKCQKLALVLYGYEVEGKEIPRPSSRESIEVHQGEFVNDIGCDTLAYRKMYNNKSVRKNVTLPEWLNEEAEALKIHFSQVLQEALLQKLGRT